MKKTTFSFLTLLCFFIFCFSCQPKDEKIIRPGPAARDQNGAADQFSAAMSSIETNQLFALTIDRAAEQIHLLKSILNSSYASSYNLILIDSKNSMVKLDEATMRVDLSGLLLQTGKATDETKKNKKISSIDAKIEKIFIDEEGVFKKLVLLKNLNSDVLNIGLKNISESERLDFKSKTMSEQLVIEWVSAGVYSIQLNRIDNISSKKDRDSILQTDLNAQFFWSGQVGDLNQPLQLMISKFNLIRKGDKKANLIAYVSPENQLSLTVDLSSCLKLTGELKLNSKTLTGDKKKDSEVKSIEKHIKIVDSSVAIESEKFESKSQTCGDRPVVDLNRML